MIVVVYGSGFSCLLIKSFRILLTAAALAVFTINAREKQGVVKQSISVQRVFASCGTPEASAELAVNNVRTIIYSGSDMWWATCGRPDDWRCRARTLPRRGARI